MASFFLKTIPVPGAPPNPYTGLYLRLHGGGINSVVLTPGQPKFIKAHEDSNRISFTSSSHEDRRWGLTLSTDGQQRAGWEKVEIVQDGGSEGFAFSETNDAHESILVYGNEENEEKIWRGWMVCHWAHGHPQLFWMTDQLKHQLPEYCHPVQIVREIL